MIYVLSDVHGNKEHFDRILKKINLQAEDSLYILGDIVDRYPYGIELLQRVMKMPNVHMLLGNHEWMMMKALDISYSGTADTGGSVREFPKDETRKKNPFDLWYWNDGQVTHEAWSRLTREEQKELADFLSGLPLSYELTVNKKKYKLVHAAPVEWYHRLLMPNYDSAVDFAVWDREMYRLKSTLGYTLILGHTPTLHMQDNNPLEIWTHRNMIGIDCGCGFPEMSAKFPIEGRLACLRLDDGRVFYSN